MCTIPPAPPLPPRPPPVLSDNHSPTELTKIDSQNPSYDYSGLCEWASEQPCLWEVCIKYNLCLKSAPYRYKFNNCNSILQVGPTCGLAALSMLVKGKVTADKILNIAKLEGYSNNGEMFSCINMAKLAEKVFSLADFNNVKCYIRNGGLVSKEIIDKMLEGAVLLVPYDADCNHSPCLKNGHTAHWGIICGIIIIKDAGEFYDSCQNNIYVISRHGKSRFLAAWSLADLAKSNKNLWEFSPKRGDDGLKYILPEGGIGGKEGLRNQFLVIEGL
ncbi:unnamed protein product [Diatraea saccharalis]|uniref:Actin maturation protease n=1 Tax=Diatraea saccharalis TaxID=40085 RepID=A0A9N9WFU3_9NEOP|nr:unnamed protein product [Diatraea saccharalis]